MYFSFCPTRFVRLRCDDDDTNPRAPLRFTVLCSSSLCEVKFQQQPRPLELKTEENRFAKWCKGGAGRDHFPAFSAQPSIGSTHHCHVTCVGSTNRENITRCALNRTVAWCELDQSRNAHVKHRVICAWPTTEHLNKFALPDWPIVFFRHPFWLFLLFTWPARLYILCVASQSN